MSYWWYLVLAIKETVLRMKCPSNIMTVPHILVPERKKYSLFGNTDKIIWSFEYSFSSIKEETGFTEDQTQLNLKQRTDSMKRCLKYLIWLILVQKRLTKRNARERYIPFNSLQLPWLLGQHVCYFIT